MKRFLIAMLFLPGCLCGFAQWSWQNPRPQGHELNTVFFVDNLTGYAAGAYGTILKTSDGGVHWVIQPGGTTFNLQSVFFTAEAQRRREKSSDNEFFASLRLCGFSLNIDFLVTLRGGVI